MTTFKLAIIIFFLPTFLLAQSIDRIEPPFWWSGMKDPTLQILVHGKNLGRFKQATSHSVNVTVTGIATAANPDYLFIDLQLTYSHQDEVVPIILSDGTNDLTINYPIKTRDPKSSSREGYNSTDVIYLITPDRFANADPTNDNLPDLQDKINRSDPLGRHGGDIGGVIQNLDYISDMGFTALWLNPVLENKMPRHSYHGYAITDFYKTDERFGSNEDYRELCQKASEKGIKVIMDMVVNHCGLEHWWMKAPPFSDWINYNDQPFQQTNHRKTISTDPYVSVHDKRVLFDGWFVRTMPDLNVRNKYLSKYLIQNTLWWIEYAGLSGIRMDTYPYPDEGFMADWSKAVMTEYPAFNITGEIWYDDPGVISYWQKGKTNTNGYTSWLPSLFDFPLQTAMSKSLTSSGGWEDNWMPLYEMLAKDFHYYDPFQMVVFADNHDMSRVFTQLGEDFNKFKLAMAYILTVRGIPQIYYGTEILMTNPGTDNHGVIRSDFPGGWNGDSTHAFTGSGLTPQQLEAKEFLKKLLNWRQDQKAIHTGRTIHFAPEKGVYAFIRFNTVNGVLVILNRNEQATTIQMDKFKEGFLGAKNGVEVITGKEITLTGELQLSHAGPMIVEFMPLSVNLRK